MLLLSDAGLGLGAYGQMIETNCLLAAHTARTMIDPSGLILISTAGIAAVRMITMAAMRS